MKPLLDSSPARLRDIWYAFLVTGLRKDELAGLTFRDVDWEAREIVIRRHRATGKRERRIPIDAGLWDILCRQREEAPFRQPGKGRTPGACRSCWATARWT